MKVEEKFMDIDRILHRLSIFHNRSFNFSNCKNILIPFDKIITDCYKELFNKELNLYDVDELNDLRLKMNNELYSDLLNLIKKDTNNYLNIKGTPKTQLLYSITISICKIVEKYPERIHQVFYTIFCIRIFLLPADIVYTLDLLISEEAHLSGIEIDSYTIIKIGEHNFNPITTAHKYFYPFKGKNLDIIDIIPDELFFFNYIREMDLSIYKIFWNYYYELILNKKVDMQIAGNCFLMQCFVFPTLNTEQIENVIRTFYEEDIYNDVFLQVLDDLNSDYFEKYRSYLLAKDLAS